MSDAFRRRAWSVVLAGTGINLALGVLYTWSIFKGAIQRSIESGGEGAFAWQLSTLNDPYAVCTLVFALSMILAGRCQDRFGPRLTALIGGLLVGLGFLCVSLSTSYWVWVLGFGVLAGTGIGFGYSAATPPGLKWFPSARTGLVAGVVVGGFGLASVYIAPLAQLLLGAWGLQPAMLFFGLAFAVVVSLLSLRLVNPPAGWDPERLSRPELAGGAAATAPVPSAHPGSAPVELAPAAVLRTAHFWLLWVLYFIGAGAGLMVIASIAGMAKASLGEAAFVAVALLAVGNAAGRVVAGSLSDRIGRASTLCIMLLLQAGLMFAAIPVVGATDGGPTLLVLLATLIGFNYGTNLALFPAFAKDAWGLRHFGANYGLLFTAWGAGGFVLSRVSQMIRAETGSFSASFVAAGILLLVGALLARTVAEQPRASRRPEGPRPERLEEQPAAA